MEKQHPPKKEFDFWREAKIVLAALFDPRTPGFVKVLMVLGLLYGLTPLDVLPDFLPLIGEADDVAVLVFAVWMFWQKTKDVRKRWREEFSK